MSCFNGLESFLLTNLSVNSAYCYLFWVTSSARNFVVAGGPRWKSEKQCKRGDWNGIVLTGAETVKLELKITSRFLIAWILCSITPRNDDFDHRVMEANRSIHEQIKDN